MKILTPCITGALMTSLAAWGCGNTSADERADPDEAADGPGDTPPEVVDDPGGSTLIAARLPAPGCPTRTSSSVASHIVIEVSWPSSLAIAAGSGEVHVWTKADLAYQGNDYTGTARPCGSLIPPLTKAALVGGGQVGIEIPGSAWDSPRMPVFQIRGSTGGFTPGSSIAMEPVTSLVGLTMANPMSDPWPGQASLLTPVDHDGDGRPGIKAIPRKDPPFGAPPVDLAGVLDPKGARADEVDLAMRTILGLSGARDSCTSAEGRAQVTRLDSHVVGCHIEGAGACTQAQSDFIDASQPRFDIGSATFQMVEVPASATCADVRAVLPAH